MPDPLPVSKPAPEKKWASRKLWLAVGFVCLSFALQWFGKVEPGTWQFLAGPMMAYLIGQSYVDGKRV